MNYKKNTITEEDFDFLYSKKEVIENTMIDYVSLFLILSLVTVFVVSFYHIGTTPIFSENSFDFLFRRTYL